MTASRSCTGSPRLWGLVLEQVVPVSLARHAAAHTRDLEPEIAGHADRMACADPAHIDRVEVERLVDQVRLHHDPDRAIDDEQQALAARRVELMRGRTPATTEVWMSLDTPDALAFERAVGHGAEALKALGDHDSLDVRRARAVGILADPQRALDLFAGRGTDAKNLLPPTVWLHLDESTLADLVDAPGVVRAEGLGVLTTDRIKAWLADSTVIIRPVLDLARTDSVDPHDAPLWMADLVRLRDRHCVFPGCRRSSRSCDLDHIEPYVPPDDGGPPGQTRSDNLAPLCRRHHRAKTHGRWRYRRRSDGSCHWISPSGRIFVALPAGPRLRLT